MENDRVGYYRARASAECEAALSASCAEARHAHAGMAEAYEHLAQIAELERLGELAPGKVMSMAETLHLREQTEYGRRPQNADVRRDTAQMPPLLDD